MQKYQARNRRKVFLPKVPLEPKLHLSRVEASEQNIGKISCCGWSFRRAKTRVTFELCHQAVIGSTHTSIKHLQTFDIFPCTVFVCF